MKYKLGFNLIRCRKKNLSHWNDGASPTMKILQHNFYSKLIFKHSDWF